MAVAATRSGRRLLRSFQQLDQRWPHGVEQLRLRGSSRVDAVRLKLGQIGTNAVKEERDQSAAHGLCHVGVHRLKLRGVSGAEMGGILMPTTSTRAPAGFASSPIFSRFAWAAATGEPRRPSLPPSSITTSVGLCLASSAGGRARPPAVVSPLILALVTCAAIFCAPAFCQQIDPTFASGQSHAIARRQ